MIQYLSRENKPDLAYVKIEAREENSHEPVIVFLGGFRSDMEGTKAIFLENMCKEKGLGYVRFDYSGHGVSKGAFEEGSIGDWAEDAKAILDHCAQGSVILVGSSMGGWISLLLALSEDEKVQALVGLAAAPDFTKIMEERMNDAQKQALETQGYFALENDYSDEPYVITKKLIDDGRNQCLLEGKIEIECPVRLIQGKKDTDVAWETAEKIKEHITHDNVEVILLDEADHRLSSPEQLQVLQDTIEKLL